MDQDEKLQPDILGLRTPPGLGLNVRFGAVEDEHQVPVQLGVGRDAGALGVGLGVRVLLQGGRSC